MLLANAFKNYLLDRNSKEARTNLLRELTENGYRLESLLASAYFENNMNTTQVSLENCPWLSRNAWISSELPSSAQAGDIWMDIIEMTPMILIPFPEINMEDWSEELLIKMGRNYTWVSLRPVAKWQFKTFLDLSVKATYDVQVPPPFLVMDSQRITSGNTVNSEVVNVLRAEGWIYALWFNKYIVSSEGWEYLYHYLTVDEVNSCWGGTKKEWVDYYINETTSTIYTPETVFLDIDESLESEDPEIVALAESMICNEWKFFADVTFRTAVPVHVGLVNRWESPIDIGDIQFPSCFRR